MPEELNTLLKLPWQPVISIIITYLRVWKRQKWAGNPSLISSRRTDEKRKASLNRRDANDTVSQMVTDGFFPGAASDSRTRLWARIMHNNARGGLYCLVRGGFYRSCWDGPEMRTKVWIQFLREIIVKLQGKFTETDFRIAASTWRQENNLFLIHSFAL